MAYKTFLNGYPLPASELNTYLMGQVVATFANASERSAAIASPSEGQVTYLEDSNQYFTYTGSAWTPLVAPSSGNAIINGGFDFWQRGTSSAVGFGTYLADRWQAVRSGFTAGSTYSRQSSGLTGFTYAARLQRDSGNTSTAFLRLGQTLESVTSIPLAGNTLTLSFYARAGANFSAANSILKSFIVSGTGTDQNEVTGAFTGEAFASANNTLTTSWTRFTLNYAMPTNATQLAVMFQYDAVGTAGAADWFEITGVQLEAGSVATPFRRNAPSIQGELAACERYFKRFLFPDGFSIAVLQAVSSTSAVGKIADFMTMRSTPTVSVSGTSHFKALNATGGAYLNSSAMSLGSNLNQVFFNSLTVASGLVAGNATFLAANNASCYVDLNAEL